MSDAVGRDLVDDLLAASMDGVALLGGSTHRRVNEAYAAMFGADSPDALIDAGWRERFPPAVTDRVASATAEGDGGTAAGDEGTATSKLSGVECTRLDGERFPADVSVRPTDEGAVVVVREVAEAERRERERSLSALHDAVQAIQEARTAEEVFECATEAVHEVLGWPMSVCWRHEECSSRLEPVATRELDGTTFTPDDPEYEVFESGDPRVRDVSETCSHLPDDADQGVLFPLDDAGMLGAATTDGRGYAEWEFETMEVLAAHVETALVRIERERDLRESEARYRELVDAAPIPIGIVDDDLDLAYVNDSGTEFLGIDDPDAAVGTPADAFVDEEYREWALGAVRRTIDEGIVGRPMEVRYRTLDGQERIAVGATSPTTWDGDPAAQVVLNDVTEFRRSRERYERLVEYAPVPIVIVGQDGDLAYCNQAAAEFYGAPDRESLIGRTAFDLIHQEGRETARESLAMVVSEGEAITGTEQRFIRLDGEERVAIASLAPITYEGEPAAQVVLKDVTERKRRERELEESERRHRTLVENFPNGGVSMFDEDLRYTVAGGEIFDDPAYPIGSLEGTTAYEQLGGHEELRELLDAYEAAIEGEATTLDVTFEGREWVVHVLPVRDEDGEVFAGMTMSQDVTEQRERERELRRKEHQYRALAENIPGGSVSLFERTDDGDVRYTLAAGSVFENVSLDADEMEGERFSEVHADSFRNAHREKFEAALRGEPSQFEFEFEGRIFEAHVVPIEEEGDPVGMIMSQDVTDRRERERELQRKERRYRTLAERIPNAVISLFEPTEDGDLRYDLLAGSMFDRLSFDAGDFEGKLLTDVHSDEFGEAHLQHFWAALDGESRTFEFTVDGRSCQGYTLPIEDENGEIISGMAMTLDVTEQRERERELERQRDELETINRINGLLLNITQALSEAPTKEELETTVCERLAASDLYRFAWIGERTIGSDVVTPLASAGHEEGYLEEVSIPAGKGLAAQGPAGEAMRTGEVQVVHDVRTDERFEPWREAAEERGYRSIATVPLAHGDAVYGILAVYSARTEAFSDREQAAFGILGETIGFVINALQNRRLLVADAVTELTFEVNDPSALLVSISDQFDATVTLEGHTATDENVWLAYLGVDDVAPSAVVEYLLGDNVHTGIKDAWVIEDHDDGGLIGIRETDPSFVTGVLDAGATLREARATEGRLRTTLEVPGSADVRNVVELLQGIYPGIELVAQREHDRPVRTAAEFRESLEEQLTERQLAALRAAYYGGYFEWPRESTAEDVAESMGIASATLHNHLRKAQRQLLSLFFESEAGPDDQS